MIKVLGNNSSILNNTASILNIPSLYDSALFFDSDNDIVTINDSLVNRFSIANNFCISAIFNPEEIGASGTRFIILSKRNATSGNAGYELYLFKTSNTSYSLSFIVFDTGGRANLIAYPLSYDCRNRWLHCVINKYNNNPASSVSASEWEMFIDGKQVTPTVSSNTLITSSNIATSRIITINNIDGSSFYSKLNVSRLMIFGRKLSASEVTLLYNSEGKQKPLDGIVKSKTGTVTTPNVGFFTLSGSGTSFLSELSVGMCIFSSANVPLGFISSITNNTTAIYVNSSTVSYSGTYKAGYLLAEYDFIAHSGTSLSDTSIVANNGSLTGFANTSLGASNQWKNGNTLTSWTV